MAKEEKCYGVAMSEDECFELWKKLHGKKGEIYVSDTRGSEFDSQVFFVPDGLSIEDAKSDGRFLIMEF